MYDFANSLGSHNVLMGISDNPVAEQPAPAWAHPLLAWLSVLFLGLYIFVPGLR